MLCCWGNAPFFLPSYFFRWLLLLSLKAVVFLEHWVFVLRHIVRVLYFPPVLCLMGMNCLLHFYLRKSESTFLIRLRLINQY